MLADFMPCLAMILVQTGYAGMNISSKLAMESGMKPLVLVAYRQIFATIAIAPFAFYFERKTRPKFTMSILFQLFLCATTGATTNHVCFYIGLDNSSPAIAGAIANLVPAVTFLLAALFRLEEVGIKTAAGLAKVIGTIVCISGSMLLSLYHGHIIDITVSEIHWNYVEQITHPSSSKETNFLGPFLLILASVAWASWYIIQARLVQKFRAPYTTSAVMCFISSIQCATIGFISEHRISAWALTSSIRLVAALFAAIVCNAFAFCLVSWTIGKKGPLYVSVFSPLMFVIVAIISWAVLHEKFFVGTVVGSILIVVGLYTVLWGKDKEIKKLRTKYTQDGQTMESKQGQDKSDLELGNDEHLTSYVEQN